LRRTRRTNQNREQQNTAKQEEQLEGNIINVKQAAAYHRTLNRPVCPLLTMLNADDDVDGYDTLSGRPVAGTVERATMLIGDWLPVMCEMVVSGRSKCGEWENDYNVAIKGTYRSRYSEKYQCQCAEAATGND
jgi:hypothetical protein